MLKKKKKIANNLAKTNNLKKALFWSFKSILFYLKSLIKRKNKIKII